MFPSKLKIEHLLKKEKKKETILDVRCKFENYNYKKYSCSFI